MDGKGIGQAIKAVFALAVIGWLIIMVAGGIVLVHFLSKFW